MALYLIGMGLNDEEDLSLKALHLAKNADVVYLETYTGKFNGDIDNLKKLLNKPIKIASRDFLENRIKEVIEQAKKSKVCVLVIGDVFSATTHINYLIEARKAGIEFRVVHGSSIFSAVAITGLHLYKFGKTVSIPFPQKSFVVTSYYHVIEENLKNNAHTLVLLDINTQNNQHYYMSFNQALKLLLEAEQKEKKGIIKDDTMLVVCAKLGAQDFEIMYGKLSDLIKKNLDHKKPHCIVIPANHLHFSEQEALKLWEIR